MTPDTSGAGSPVPKTQRGRHRAPRQHRPILVRTIGVGGVACCIGFVAEMNAPDADALSIILPSGKGNATQINILEGNIFNPQFGLGGNGSNTSHNSTIGALFFGQGNGGTGTTGESLFGPIKLGGATGNGNVTQVNILSYNIFNPQVGLNGNSSKNTTISSVAVNNGNDASTTESGGGAVGLFGGAIGNGNTTQLSFFSGNIFNPQFSLFGPNSSDNTAIANIAGLNGNRSDTNVTSGGFLGTGLFGQTGNGNTNQLAIGVANIFNPQFSLLGTNLSRNYANANQATGNANDGANEVTASAGMWNFLAVGNTGNGNTTQNAQGSGNIVNEQWRLGLGSLLPGTPTTPAPGQQTETTQDAVEVTNEQVTAGGAGQSGPLTNEELLQLQTQQPGSTSSTGRVVSSRPLKEIATRLKNAVDETIDRITKPRKPATTSGPDNPPASNPDDES